MSTLLVRYLKPFIERDLQDKMIFLGGPRQVGKTTFAQSLIPSFEEGNPAYLNWDYAGDKKKILNWKLPSLPQKLVIFDEVHKFKRWRNLMKGYYDTFKKSHQFLITGSARLDHYRKGGDSLLGRYFYYRLHPLSWSELKSQNQTKLGMEHLLKFGGFPEPFLKGTERDLRRWHLQRNSRIIDLDIRNLENVRDISLIELLISALPDRVGATLSKKNLAQDLEVDFKTIEKWLTILENVYYCYRISPFGAPKIKAIKKSQKLFLWDWSELEDTGARWENFIASHLLKYCHYLEDTEGYKMELRFLRDIEEREVDFVVLQNKKPLFAVECKFGEKQVSPAIKYFSERTSIPMFYQVHSGTSDYQHTERIRVLPFERFCTEARLV